MALATAPLIVLGALAVSACVRMVLAFETDALTIAVLSGLLFWTQWRERRRSRVAAEKVEALVLKRDYGPLSAEDLVAIHALRAERERDERRPNSSAPKRDLG